MGGGGVAPGGVLRGRLEDDDGLGRKGSDGGVERREGEGAGGGVVVGERGGFEVEEGEDVEVVDWEMPKSDSKKARQ